MKIITDNKWKNLLFGYELPEKIKKEFDYINNDSLNTESFIKYKNNYYYINDFLTTIGMDNLKNWHGYQSDTYFSGVLIKLSGDVNKYKIGRFFK